MFYILGYSPLSAVELTAESMRLSSGTSDEEMDIGEHMPSLQPHSLSLPPPTQSFDVLFPIETD